VASPASRTSGGLAGSTPRCRQRKQVTSSLAGCRESCWPAAQATCRTSELPISRHPGAARPAPRTRRAPGARRRRPVGPVLAARVPDLGAKEDYESQRGGCATCCWSASRCAAGATSWSVRGAPASTGRTASRTWSTATIPTPRSSCWCKTTSTPTPRVAVRGVRARRGQAAGGPAGVPRHLNPGSWLNMAEIELAVLAEQRLIGGRPTRRGCSGRLRPGRRHTTLPLAGRQAMVDRGCPDQAQAA
jgi:hypothetical protein